MIRIILQWIIHLRFMRKLQLRESGFLAANQNVAIPPQSSKQNNALDTSYNEQNNHYEKDWHGIYRWLFPQEKTSKNSLSRYWQLSRTFREFTNGYLGINETMKILTMTKEN